MISVSSIPDDSAELDIFLNVFLVPTAFQIIKEHLPKKDSDNREERLARGWILSERHLLSLSIATETSKQTKNAKTMKSKEPQKQTKLYKTTNSKHLGGNDGMGFP